MTSIIVTEKHARALDDSKNQPSKDRMCPHVRPWLTRLRIMGDHR